MWSERRKRRRAIGRPADLVEVQVGHRDPVAEGVLAHGAAAVGDRALVEGAHAGTASRPSAATARCGARDAVLVEAPAPVGAAEVRAVAPADLAVALLGRLALDGVDRVRVGDRADDLRRVDRVGAVEGHAVLVLGVERLQAVHVVRDGGRTARVRDEVVVPARPCPPAAREQTAVRVQDRLVGLVGEGAEDLALGRRGVGEHARAPGRRARRSRPRRRPRARRRPA